MSFAIRIGDEVGEPGLKLRLRHFLFDLASWFAAASLRARVPRRTWSTLGARCPCSWLTTHHLDRLDRASRKLDSLLSTEQIQQNNHALVRPQNRKHPNLLA
jgi:hypothetical protein